MVVFQIFRMTEIFRDGFGVQDEIFWECPFSMLWSIEMCIQKVQLAIKPKYFAMQTCAEFKFDRNVMEAIDQDLGQSWE